MYGFYILFGIGLGLFKICLPGENRTLRGQQRSHCFKELANNDFLCFILLEKKMLACMEADSEEYTDYIRDTVTLRPSWSGG